MPPGSTARALSWLGMLAGATAVEAAKIIPTALGQPVEIPLWLLLLLVLSPTESLTELARTAVDRAENKLDGETTKA